MTHQSPRGHAATITEKISYWQEYLDHQDMSARIMGLNMLIEDIDYLITKEWMTLQRQDDAPTPETGSIRNYTP